MKLSWELKKLKTFAVLSCLFLKTFFEIGLKSLEITK